MVATVPSTTNAMYAVARVAVPSKPPAVIVPRRSPLTTAPGTSSVPRDRVNPIIGRAVVDAVTSATALVPSLETTSGPVTPREPAGVVVTSTLSVPLTFWPVTKVFAALSLGMFVES